MEWNPTVVKSLSSPHHFSAIYGVPHNIAPRNRHDVGVVLILLAFNVRPLLSPM
jgi:hypothetical protein